MKRNLFWAALLGLALAFTPAVPAQAQVLSLTVSNVDQVGGNTTDDGDTALVIKYIGSSQSGTVEVDAAGDLTFLSGDSGAEAADTSLECPVSGALGGIIDVSNAACDTVVEVLDIINDSSGNWVAFPVTALGTDSSNDTFLLTAAAAAQGAAGYTVKFDTTTAFNLSHAYTDLTGFTNADGSLNRNVFNPDGSLVAGSQRRKPEMGRQAVVNAARTVSTYASGTSFFNCFSVDYYFNEASADDFNYVETITQVYSIANGATTVALDIDQELVGGIFGKKDQKLICRIDNSAAASSATLTTSGLQFTY